MGDWQVNGMVLRPAPACAANPTSWRPLQGRFRVIEAITESLATKQVMFRTLEASVGREVILTNNTSGFRISDIVRDLKGRNRTATTHFWFPGHLVPLVEIVMGKGSDPAVA